MEIIEYVIWDTRKLRIVKEGIMAAAPPDLSEDEEQDLLIASVDPEDVHYCIILPKSDPL